MAKKEKDSVIALEVESFEEKIAQFQSYLITYDIRYIEEDKKRHDEIDAQIKIMSALPTWLIGLAKLRENKDDTKKVEVRADSEVSGLMKKELKMNY